MTRHAAAGNPETRGVRDQRHLHRELGPIRERRDHLRLLAPLSGEVPLATTLKVAVCPGFLVWLAGWVVMEGAVATTTVSAT